MSTSDSGDVRERIEEWGRAFASRDISTVMEFYAAGTAFRGFDVAPPAEYDDSTDWRTNWTGFLAAWDESLRLDLIDVRVDADREIAIATFQLRLTGRLFEHESFTLSRQTVGLRRIDGTWTIIHHHVSLPVDLGSGQPVRDSQAA